VSSISEKIANNIIKNNGVYTTEDGETDPQCYAVFKIKNSYFGHEHFVVAHTKESYEAYLADHKLVALLWMREEEKSK